MPDSEKKFLPGTFIANSLNTIFAQQDGIGPSELAQMWQGSVDGPFRADGDDIILTVKTRLYDSEHYEKRGGEGGSQFHMGKTPEPPDPEALEAKFIDNYMILSTVHRELGLLNAVLRDLATTRTMKVNLLELDSGQYGPDFSFESEDFHFNDGVTAKDVFEVRIPVREIDDLKIPMLSQYLQGIGAQRDLLRQAAQTITDVAATKRLPMGAMEIGQQVGIMLDSVVQSTEPNFFALTMGSELAKGEGGKILGEVMSGKGIIKPRSAAQLDAPVDEDLAALPDHTADPALSADAGTHEAVESRSEMDLIPEDTLSQKQWKKLLSERTSPTLKVARKR